MSTNPYKSTSPRLRLSVIAFVDVLGDSDLVREPRSRTENLELLARLHEVLRRSRQWLDGPASDQSTQEEDGEKDLHALVAFTDNIVIGWPVDPWGLPEMELDPILDDAESQLGFAFMGLAGFQFAMANAGFFVRGAVAVGDAYVDEYCVFGEGLLEATRASRRGRETRACPHAIGARAGGQSPGVLPPSGRRASEQGTAARHRRAVVPELPRYHSHCRG